jgi:hypothetical protein
MSDNIERGDLLVAAAKRATGLPVRGIADLLGVHYTVVWRWQSGERSPRGPAKALLRVMAREPQAVMRALGHQPKEKAVKVAEELHEPEETTTTERTPVASQPLYEGELVTPTPPPRDHVSGEGGFAGDGPPPGTDAWGNDYDQHMGYTGGQEKPGEGGELM